MALLSSGPAEVVSLIFQNCSNFCEALAFASTCKHVFSVWQENKGGLILRVGRNDVLAFDEALIVVRSTRIVKNAHEQGVLPPNIVLEKLDPDVNKPTVLEAEAVLNLRCLARCLEHKFLNRSKIESLWGEGKHLRDISPQLLSVFQETFHRALYRFFIVGAVLSRAFLEPFFDGKTDDPYFFLGPTRDRLEAGAGDSYNWIGEMPMYREELDHFYKYPIYSFVSHPGWEDCFGDLGTWLITSTRKRLESTRSINADASSERIDGEVLREVMQLLVIYGQMTDMKNGLFFLDQEPFWVRHWKNSTGGSCICHPDMPSDNDADYQTPRKSKEIPCTVEVVFSRAWEPRIVHLLKTQSFSDPSCVAEEDFYYTKIQRGETAPEMSDILDILEIIHCLSERPNIVNNHTAPHPPLHLFTFLLKKHFGYRFDDLAFDMDTPLPNLS